jgi:recombinational DNA repair protein (RecF pathway)
METSPCADCGIHLPEVTHWSFYFERPLCAPCYRAEQRRTKQDNEIRILEQLFTRSAA